MSGPCCYVTLCCLEEVALLDLGGSADGLCNHPHHPISNNWLTFPIHGVDEAFCAVSGPADFLGCVVEVNRRFGYPVCVVDTAVVQLEEKA